MSESDSIATIDIVVGGDHSQGKFRSICNFVLRDINVKKLNSCVRKNAHIGCDKDTYDVLNEPIVKPINNEIKTIMRKDIFVFFMWDDNK